MNARMRRVGLFSVLLFSPGFALAPNESLANDSTAVLAAGGLRLERTDKIAIISEKLRISPARVSVDYEMQNIAADPIETVIAFPLPLLEARELTTVPFDIDPERPEKFIDFKTSVNGVAIRPEQQVKAYQVERPGSLSRDVTEILRSAHILLSPLDRAFFDRLDELPEGARERLRQEKLLDISEHESTTNLTPLWATEYSYFSKQLFPPGKLMRIHHEYRPIAGRSLFGDFSAHDDLSAWCVDAGTRKAVEKLLAEQPVTGGWTKVLEKKQVDYILTTGANWAGPIRKFELTLEKQSPRQIISLCARDLKKISDTEFRLVRSDYIPAENLTVIFFDRLDVGR